jgi:hypothetical protein
MTMDGQNISLSELPRPLVEDWYQRVVKETGVYRDKKTELTAELLSVEKLIEKNSDLIYKLELFLKNASSVSKTEDAKIPKYNIRATWREKVMFITENPEKYGLMRTAKDVAEVVLREEGFTGSENEKLKIYRSVSPTLSDMMNRYKELIRLHKGQDYIYASVNIFDKAGNMKDEYKQVLAGYQKPARVY